MEATEKIIIWSFGHNNLMSSACGGKFCTELNLKLELETEHLNSDFWFPVRSRILH